MAQARIVVDVDVAKARRFAEAFLWFAGRVSAAADELYQTLDELDRDTTSPTEEE